MSLISFGSVTSTLPYSLTYLLSTPTETLILSLSANPFTQLSLFLLKPAPYSHFQPPTMDDTLIPYPSSWPKPTDRRFTLVCRITEQQKLDLYNRRITTRALAITLGVREAYLSTIFPGKIPSTKPAKRPNRAKRDLILARKAFRAEQARAVLSGKMTIAEAAKVANTGYRNMARVVKALREATNV